MALTLDTECRYLNVMTIDDQQPDWSGNTTYDKMNVILAEIGAIDTINFVGGDFTTLCIREPMTDKPVVISHAIAQGAYCCSVAMNFSVYLAQ